VLVKLKVRPLPRPRKKSFKKYEVPIAGVRVQMGTCKIEPGLFQFTANDDCTGIKSSLFILGGQPRTRSEFWTSGLRKHLFPTNGLKARALKIPENIRLSTQPSHSPELNPAEHLWDELREKYLYNKSLRTQDDFQEALCD
jgi:hypothetical protein